VAGQTFGRAICRSPLGYALRHRFSEPDPGVNVPDSAAAPVLVGCRISAQSALSAGEFESLWDGVWWAVVTVTTVG
jgi:hypothetical protein